MRASFVGALCLAVPTTATAQDALLLRYRPSAGSRMQTVAETRVTTIAVGLPSLPDSTVIESSWRTVASHRIVEVRGSDRVVSALFDSSRARARVGTGSRNDVLLPGVQGITIGWRLSERLEASEIAGGPGGDSASIAAMVATFGGFALTLPEAPVRIGGEWSAPLSFPLGGHLTAAGKVASPGSLAGRATVKLDSLVSRGADTLAFLALRGVADPTRIAVAGEGGVGEGTFSGAFAGALVWSTGWNAVVSAVTSGSLSGTIRITRPEGPVNGALSLTIAGRYQVRL